MKALLAVLFGGLKLGKVFTTGGTMLLSLFAYTMVFGWPYAVGFVALLFCHEMGHYLAARKCGLEVGAPTFIPFVGAWIQLKDQPMNARIEAYIGMAGPLVGTLAALACYAVARAEDSSLLLAIAYSGFFLNLFNLIPLLPLDGGRMTAVISRKFWLIGAPLLVAVFLWRPSPLLILIAILAAPQIWSSYQGKSDSMPEGYYDSASLENRIEYALLYLGLVSFLAVISYDVHEMLGAIHP